jgi:hypothetical protein
MCPVRKYACCSVMDLSFLFRVTDTKDAPDLPSLGKMVDIHLVLVVLQVNLSGSA